MKKFLCTVLALALCLSLTVSAFAAAPSKTQEDMTEITVTPKDDNAKLSGSEFIKVPSTKEPKTDEEKAEAKEYKEVLEVCENELEVLKKAGTADKYFAVLKDKEEKNIEFKDIVKDVLKTEKIEDVKIHEFAPIVAGGFTEKCGDMELEILFPTPYEKGQKVIVLIGIVTEGKDGNEVQWYAIEGVGLEADSKNLEEKGRIKLELSEELILKIQSNKALLAVASIDKAK